jgi:hypothetical protein
MSTITNPVCCGVPSVRHTRPIHGTDTYVHVFRCPSCGRGQTDEIPHTATGLENSAGSWAA